MRIRSPFLVNVLSRVAVTTARTICRSCRFEKIGDLSVDLYGDIDETFLYSAWHEDIVLSLLTRRPARNTAALVSQHRDGDWVTSIMRAVGVKPVRGSTSRGAARALREMLDVTRTHHVCITSDGPRGPRREVKPGLVYLASKTGRRIVPASYACRSKWELKGNWTVMTIPKPFTTVYAVGGDPIAVPPKVDREGIEHYTALLQRAMDEVTDVAQRLARGEKVESAIPMRERARLAKQQDAEKRRAA